MALAVDPAVLAKEAENFGRIAGELRTVMSHVETIAGGLKVNLNSEAAGAAAQAALVRFNEASTKLNLQLDEISTNIHVGGGQYTSTDADQASNLASQMGNTM